MNDQQNRTRPNGSDCYPTFLILESDVTLRNRVGIVENENGRFEANIVLVKVLPVLLLVPFKSHGSPRLGGEYGPRAHLSIHLYVQSAVCEPGTKSGYRHHGFKGREISNLQIWRRGWDTHRVLFATLTCFQQYA
jgi:hypothetical protein